MREILPYRDEDRPFLADPENGGGSSIIGANSMILAGPMSGAEEGILTADINLEECVKAKVVHDYAGHYNRADIFRLTVNTAVPGIYETLGEMTSAVPPSEEKRDAKEDPLAPSRG
jgi:nitrilase